MLPTVDFCGLTLTRLVIGANPFGGFSHQNRVRDEAMRAYHTPERIVETWRRAEAAGINAMVTNNESPNVLEALRDYRRAGGALQWIAQVNCRHKPTMEDALDEVAELGCDALYFQGGLTDNAWRDGAADRVRRWCDHARRFGVPVGAAGHSPAVHAWLNSLGVLDFHAVCFFNCGSLHNSEGDRFQLQDVAPAAACLKSIAKPCIAYKILGAGRIEARMAFEYAFEHTKPGDVVNVGMHRGDRDDLVEANAALVREILGG